VNCHAHIRLPCIMYHMHLFILYSYCTALKAASYFDDSRPIPPTLAFGLGSLGFLAPFAIEEARPMITRVLQAHIKPMGCTLRTRLRGEVYSRYVVLYCMLCICIIERYRVLYLSREGL
jgi:NAD kinase